MFTTTTTVVRGALSCRTAGRSGGNTWSPPTPPSRRGWIWFAESIHWWRRCETPRQIDLRVYVCLCGRDGDRCADHRSVTGRTAGVVVVRMGRYKMDGKKTHG